MKQDDAVCDVIRESFESQNDSHHQNQNEGDCQQKDAEETMQVGPFTLRFNSKDE